MKPMTSEALKRMALAHGGRLEMDGKNVNSARLQVVTKLAPKTELAYMREETPAPVAQTIEAKPDPVVREALSSIDNYAASQFMLNDQTAQTLNTIKDMLQKSSAQATDNRPTQWVFKVKRDAHGLMETITATAAF